MKKLLSTLNAHGIIYTVHGSEVHAFSCAFSDSYDIITEDNGKYIVTTCDGDRMPLLAWLGY